MRKALLGIVLMIFNPLIMGVLAIAIWIYLAVMIRKRKRIFHEQIEPGSAEKLSKRLKTTLIVAAVSCLVSIGGIIVHNIRSSRSESEESFYFIIGIVALYIFILATAGGMAILLRGRQKNN